MSEQPTDGLAALTAGELEIIDEIAQKVYDKLQAGMLKLSPETGRYLMQISGGGYVAVPVALTPVPNSLILYSYVMPNGGGIRIEIKQPDGLMCWSGVLNV